MRQSATLRKKIALTNSLKIYQSLIYRKNDLAGVETGGDLAARLQPQILGGLARRHGVQGLAVSDVDADLAVALGVDALRDLAVEAIMLALRRMLRREKLDEGGFDQRQNLAARRQPEIVGGLISDNGHDMVAVGDLEMNFDIDRPPFDL